MGQQSIAGAFPTIPAPPFQLGLALEDNPAVSSVSQWTPGTTVIVPLPIQAPLAQVWSILAWSIIFSAAATPSGAPGPQSFGQPGKVVGGVFRGSQRTLSNASQVGTPAALPLPGDLASLAVLWDPDSDPPFPWANIAGAFGTGGPRQYSHSEVLPSPLSLSAGDEASIGIWLEPSLVQNYTPNIFAPTYVVTYDDGQPDRAGWGEG